MERMYKVKFEMPNGEMKEVDVPARNERQAIVRAHGTLINDDTNTFDPQFSFDVYVEEM